MINVNTPSASISGSTSSARTAYPANTGSRITVYNSGSVAVFVKSGDSTVTAATTNQFVPAGQMRVFERSPNDTHLAGITASSTATIYFCVGEA